MKYIDIPEAANAHKEVIKIGDLVTTYNVGIHRVNRIARRIVEESDKHYPLAGVEITPLIWYKQVITDKGLPATRGADRSCDISYVRPVAARLKQEREKLARVEALVVSLQKKPG